MKEFHLSAKALFMAAPVSKRMNKAQCLFYRRADRHRPANLKRGEKTMSKEANFETTQEPVSASSAGLGRSAASDLIERLEGETGQRWDANDGDNATMAGLIGAMARMMGNSRHEERDNVAAGVVMRHRMSPEYQRELESREMLGNLLVAGFSPDDLKRLMG
jgi:hypothetical protein